MPDNSLHHAWILLVAYLLGSIPFGMLLAKIFGGSDIRHAGSGNIGAANVTRVVGLVAGVLTLLFDAAKGAAAVWLAARLSQGSAAWMMLAGIAALFGHCFPVWLRFKGGKGVATALGVFLVLCLPAAIVALLVFALVVASWRYISLGSISAAASMPLLMYLLWAPGHAPPLSVMFGSLAAAALIVFKHSGNIGRLARGEEPQFSFGKKKDPA